MTFFGLQLHPQYTTWDEMREAALLAEECGWDVLMTWDHFVPLMGDVTGPNLEGWQILAAFGAITKKPKIGKRYSGRSRTGPSNSEKTHVSGTNTSAATASWLPVPRRPETCHVS